MRLSSKGFTLVELMVVVAIIGILGAIAYPAYTEQIRKTRRGDAQGALMGLANAMERYRANNLGTSPGGYTGAQVPAIYPDKSPLDGTDKYYTLNVEAAGTSTYTISATRYGAQAGDECGDFELNQSGVRTLKNSSKDLADCWR